MTAPAAARRLRLEHALFLLTPLLFAGNLLVARAVSQDFPPVTLACLRWTAAGLILLPFAWRGLREHAAAILSPRFAALVLSGGVLAVAPLYAAAASTTAGNIALIVCCSPVFVLIAERVLFGVKLRPASLAGIALAALGVVTVVTRGHPDTVLATKLNAGDALAFAAMLAWVSFTLLSKRRPVKLPATVNLAALSLGAAAVLMPAALVELARHAASPFFGLHASPRALCGLLFLCLVPSIGAYGSYQSLVRAFGPAKAAASMYIVPIYAVLLAALLLGETLHAYHGAGLALVLGGVGLAAMPARSRIAGPVAAQVSVAGT